MERDKYRQLFLDEARERLSILVAALDSKASPDMKALHHEAHAMRGMAAAMGIAAIQDLAGALEDRLASCRNEVLPLDDQARSLLADTIQVLGKQVEAYDKDQPVPEAPDLTHTLRR